jgi:hypothetical protein
MSIFSGIAELILGVSESQWDSDEYQSEYCQEEEMEEDDANDAYTEEEVFEQSRQDQIFQYGSAENDESNSELHPI